MGPSKLRHLGVVHFLTLALILVLTGMFLLPTMAQQTTEEQVWSDRAGQEYVYIPPGEFMMGTVFGDDETNPDESPRHKVIISRGFWMSTTEVTVGAYKKFALATGRQMHREPKWTDEGKPYNINPGWRYEEHPIVKVNWNDAVAYCQWIGGRLPTEAEWEYAARAGTTTEYHWGNSESQIDRYANYADKSFDSKFSDSKSWGDKAHNDGYSGTSPVGTFEPNAWGLYDMSGNVYEWCSDWYDDNYYQGRRVFTDPQGPSSGRYRVLRGGSWSSRARSVRSALRLRFMVSHRYSVAGFRIVRDEALSTPESDERTIENQADAKPWDEIITEILVVPPEITNSIGMKFCLIPAGSFMMGAVPGDNYAGDDEKPRHRVTISRGFWMSTTEVTVGAYRKFALATGRQMPPEPKWTDEDKIYRTYNINPGWRYEEQPIVNVTWDDAVAYCQWVGGRLPTEAEWEYAARAGTTTKYYWGNRWGKFESQTYYKYANYADRSFDRKFSDTFSWGDKTYDDGYSGTSPVGRFEPNAWGLYDMIGNVREWCSDWYDEDYYQGRLVFTDPQGPSSGRSRVLRDGSWLSSPRYLRISNRYSVSPAFRLTYDLGFRIVRDLDQ